MISNNEYACLFILTMRTNWNILNHLLSMHINCLFFVTMNFSFRDLIFLIFFKSWFKYTAKILISQTLVNTLCRQEISSSLVILRRQWIDGTIEIQLEALHYLKSTDSILSRIGKKSDKIVQANAIVNQEVSCLVDFDDQ